METKYETLKDYLSIKHEYLASMGNHNLSKREGLQCEYQYRLMVDIIEYMDKLDEMDQICSDLMQKGSITLISDAKSQNK